MRHWPLPLLGASLFGSFLISVSTGTVRIPFEVAVAHVFGLSSADHVTTAVLDIRTLRVLAAAITGACLGASGALLQSLFRNPLADPFVLGISSGSSLAIALTLVFGLGGALISQYDPYALYAAGALGALLTSLLVISLSSVVQSVSSVVLVGVMVGYLNSGLTALVVFLSEVERARAFSFWTLGSFGAAKWSILLPLLPVSAATLLTMFLMAKPLNALAFGDETAVSMGVRLRPTNVATVAVAASALSASTLIAGPIGFIGLASAHLVKLALDTSDNRVVIPLSAVVGATVAILSDLAARSLLPPMDLPVTAVTSIFGAPLLVFLVLRRRGWK
ncbi:MAG: iron ABC transporter permease [Thaumarchaeota archaeon]|nr:iron ABC transporter permease [Candidatus Calditenuaceae archaeon]MDW8186753.1 iron ABC transporter permease [Nitrososphaerota archaeon]